MQFKSSPLIRYTLACYGLLVAYASLYPFTGWEYRGVQPWAFLSSAWPRYLTSEDVVMNTLGYVPLGFLSGAALMPRLRGVWVVLLATLACAGFSGLMEALQTLLPQRVSSNLDLGLNALGALAGATLSAAALAYLPATAKLYAFRHRYFAADASFGLVLLLIWPLAALYPQPAAFASGNMLSLVMSGLAALIADIGPLAWLEAFFRGWAPAGLSAPQLQTLSFLACASIGLLLGALSLRPPGAPSHRVQMLCVFALLLGAAVAACVASALSFGPSNALVWLTPQQVVPLALGAFAALALVCLPARLCAVLALVALLVLVSLSNQINEGPYYAQTLQSWQQGRFIRFHGLTEWLARLWAYAAVIFLVRRLVR